MDELEKKLGAVLNDPQTMEKIMSMAQSLAGPSETPPALPDAAMLGKLSAMASGMGVDRNQQALLNALRPYLSSHRLRKLEKAMGAAKMARAASSLLGGKFPQGR